MYYISISSIAYFLAFVAPEQFGWLAAVSLYILYYYHFSSTSQTFWLGMFWGIIFFSQQFFWFLLLLWGHSCAPWYIQVFLWGGLVVYASFFSGLWFAFYFYLLKYISRARAFIFSGTTFFMWMYFGSGLAWGIEQNPLCDFVLPAIIFCRAWFLYSIAPEIVLMILLLWFITFLHSNTHNAFYYLPIIFFCILQLQNESLDSGYYHWRDGSLCDAIIQASHEHKKIIVGGEGKLTDISKLELLPPDMALLCGGYFFYDDGSYDNCALCVHDGVQHVYQKKYLVPYVENNIHFCRQKLFKQRCSQKQNVVFEEFILFGTVYKPLICSDLYLSQIKQCKSFHNNVLIFFTSNEWFYFDFIKNLLKQFVKKQKSKLQLLVIYVSNEECIMM